MMRRLVSPAAALRNSGWLRRLRTAHGGTVLAAYLLASIVLIASYPALPSWARVADLLLMWFITVAAVAVGLRRTGAGERLPWWLLLAALVVTSTANILGLQRG